MFKGAPSICRDVCVKCDWRAFRDCKPGDKPGVVYELLLVHKCRACDWDHDVNGRGTRAPVLVDRELRSRLLHAVSLTAGNGAKATQAHGLLAAAVADAVYTDKTKSDRHYMAALAVSCHYTGASVRMRAGWGCFSGICAPLKRHPVSTDKGDHTPPAVATRRQQPRGADTPPAAPPPGLDPPTTPEAGGEAPPARPREGQVEVDKSGQLVVTEVASDSSGAVGGVGMLGPSAFDATLHRSTPENVQKMITERIEKKRRPFAGSDADKAELAAVVAYLRKKVFSEEKVRGVMRELPSFEEIKSKKWNRERFDNAYDDLLAMCIMRDLPGLTIQIKQEVYKRGKAPRGVINEGEVNQLCALLVIYVLEVLLFKHFGRNIKHAPKKQKMAEVVKDLGAGAAADCLGFGDFSAFDTTMTIEFRCMLENPIIHHITNVLSYNGFTPNIAMEHHMALNKQKKQKLKMKDPVAKRLGMRVEKFVIDSIRRSGHRGTSCLNFLTNYVTCTLSYFHASQAMHIFDGKPTALDRWGVVRAFKLWCEGDDSLWRTGPRGAGKRANPEKMKADIDAFWVRLGFNMVYQEVPAGSGGKLEFCGYEFSNGRVFGATHMPIIARALDKFGYSTSPQVIQALESGKEDVAAHLMTHKYIALADAYCESAPSLSKMFLNYVRDDITNEKLGGDAEMAIFGERTGNVTVPEVFKRIDETLALDPSKEVKAFHELGYDLRADEYAQFTTAQFDRSTPEACFRAQIPSAFK